MDMPRNLQAERALLGIVINHNTTLFEATQAVASADFYEPWNGELFTLLRDQIEIGRRVTPALLMSEAQDATIGEGITAHAMIVRLADEAPDDPRLVLELARQVRDCAIRRRLIEAAQLMQQEALAAPVSVTASDLRLKWDTTFSALFESAEDLGLKSLYSVNSETLTRLKKSEEVGLPVGLRPLEELMGTLLPGRLYVWAGGPGSGKSSLLSQSLRYQASRGAQAALYTPEMDEAEVGERVLATDTGVDAWRIEAGGPKIQNADYEMLWEATEASKGQGFWIDHDSSPSVTSIRGRALRKKRMSGLDILAVDHIHYLAPQDRRQAAFEALDENLKALKRLAKDLSIPVIGIAQLATDSLREMSKWPHRAPTQGDILYSGIIERHADVVLLIHREEYFLARSKPSPGELYKGKDYLGDWEARKLHPDVEGRAKLILTKRRGGLGFGTRNVGFNAKRFKFEDTTQSILKTEREGLFDLADER